jgi:hypothetical protein
MTTVTLNRSDTIERAEVEFATGRVFVVERRGVLTDADGNVISPGTKHRRPIEPDADVAAEDADVKAIATRIRTPERLARYEATREPVVRR